MDDREDFLFVDSPGEIVFYVLPCILSDGDIFVAIFKNVVYCGGHICGVIADNKGIVIANTDDGSGGEGGSDDDCARGHSFEYFVLDTAAGLHRRDHTQCRLYYPVGIVNKAGDFYVYVFGGQFQDSPAGSCTCDDKTQTPVELRQDVFAEPQNGVDIGRVIHLSKKDDAVARVGDSIFEEKEVFVDTVGNPDDFVGSVEELRFLWIEKKRFVECVDCVFLAGKEAAGFEFVERFPEERFFSAIRIDIVQRDRVSQVENFRFIHTLGIFCRPNERAEDQVHIACDLIYVLLNIPKIVVVNLEREVIEKGFCGIQAEAILWFCKYSV